MRTLKLLTLIFILTFMSCSDELSPSLSNINFSRQSTPIYVGEVQIGNQIWKTKNLNVSRYRNGDIIPEVQDPDDFVSMTTGAWCYYGNNPANAHLHGKLYNWYAVNDSRGLAPTGWHVASDQEWATLINFLGTNAWIKLSSPICFQESTPPPETNSSGFSCMPSGGRFPDQPSLDYYLGEEIWIWTSTVSTQSGFAIFRNPFYSESESAIARSGFSVRCVKN